MKKMLLMLAISPFMVLNAIEMDAPIGGEYVALDLNHVEELNDNNFKSKISKGYSIVDYYATWCGPCRVYGPTFTKVADEMYGSLSFYKVNVDTAGKTVNQANVRSIPTTILYKNGVEVKRMIGSLTEESLRDFILTGVSS